MSELIQTVAAALPQAILIGIVVGTLVYALRGNRGFTALAQFTLGLVLGVIIGAIFNWQKVLTVLTALQTSTGLHGSGIASLGLSNSDANILLQRFLIWGGIGGVIGLLRAEPGETANGAYIGGLMGLVAGVIVGAVLYYFELEWVNTYRIGVTALVVAVLLLFASIQTERRRTHIR